MALLDIFGKLFFEEPKKEDKKAPKKEQVHMNHYFGNMVEIKDEKGLVSSYLTEYGQNRINEQRDIEEALNFIRAISDANQVKVLYNLSGNLVADAEEYLAYKALISAAMHKISTLLENYEKKQETLQKIDVLLENSND